MLRRIKTTVILLLGLLAVMILLPTAYADGNGGISEPLSISAVFRQSNPEAGAQIDLDWSVTGGTAPYSVQVTWKIQESCLKKTVGTDSASGGAGVFSYNVPSYADQLWAFVTVTDDVGGTHAAQLYTELANYKHVDAASFGISNDVDYAYVGETVSASWRINAGRHTISNVRYKWVMQTTSESKDLTPWTSAGNSLTGTAAYTTAEKGPVYLYIDFDAEDGWYCPDGFFDPIQVLNQGEVPLTAEIRISPDKPNPGDTLTIEWNVTGAGANPHIWLEWTFNPESGNMDHDALDWTAASGTQTYTPTEAGYLFAWIHATNNETGVSVNQEAAYVRVREPIGDTLVLNPDHEQINRYLGFTQEMEEETGVFSWNALAGAKIDDALYEHLETIYGGKPTWKAEQTAGETLPISWSEEEEGRACDVRLESWDMVSCQPGTAEITITCTWGDQTATAVTRVNILNLPNGAPSGIDYNNGLDTVECQIGDTLEIMPGILPANWGGIPGYTPAYAGNSGEFEEFCDIIEEGDWGRKVKVTKAGIYQCFVGVGIDTVTAGRWITYQVADENGNPPVFPLENGNRTWTWYTGLSRESFSNGGVHCNDIIIPRIPDQYWKGGTPVWTVINHQDSAAGVYEFNTEVDPIGGGQDVCLIAGWEPGQETVTGINTYTVRAEYDGKVFECTETVHFVEKSPITGMTVTVHEAEKVGNEMRPGDEVAPEDGVFRLALGKDYLFTYEFVGAEPGFDSSVLCGMWPEPMLEEYGRDWNGEAYDWEENQQAFAARDVGTDEFGAFITIRNSNLMTSGNYVIEVYDPDLTTIKVDTTGERNYFIGMDLAQYGELPVGKAYTEPYVTWLKVLVAKDLENLLQGEPEWNVTADQNVGFTFEKKGQRSDINMTSLPAQDMDVTFTISCDWDGYHAETKVLVHYITASPLPTDLVYGDGSPMVSELTVRTGEPLTALETVGYNLPLTVNAEEYGTYFNNGDEHAEDGFVFWDEENERRLAGEPGEYDVKVTVAADNICVTRACHLKILNADGSEPEPKLTVQGSTDVNVYVGMPGNGLLAEGGSVWQNSMIIDLHVKPEDVRSHLNISSDPEWEIKQTGGKKLPITGGPDSRGDSHRYLRYELEKIPKEEGEAVFEVTCKWGSDVCVTDVKVHCIKIDWPTGLANIDDTVETFVGETIVFEPEIAPTGWTVPGYDQVRWGFDDEVDEFADCEPTRDSLDQINDRHTLTFKKAGTYSSTYVIVSDRVSVGREVTFHIRECPEWEFVLPEETTEIGAFAFQNIAAESVRISSRCEKIGEGAFDGSQAKYFYVPASVTEIGENAFPEGACLYTTAESSAAAWVEGRPYRVIILGE